MTISLPPTNDKELPTLTASQITPQYQLSHLLEKLKRSNHYEEPHLALFAQAYAFTQRKFSDKVHKSGMLLIDHCMAIADTLADVRVGIDALLVGLLHDIIKHSDATLEDIHQHFGASVMHLVRDVQQIRALNLNDIVKQKTELQWFFETVLKDVRVGIVRLVHRLYDLEHMEWRTKEEQRRLAEETMQIYVPLSDRLGMGTIRSRFEDAGFRYLQPDVYAALKHEVAGVQEEDEACLELVSKRVKELLEQNGIYATVEGRLKNIYSIYRKISEKQLSMAQVLDKIGLRIIVDSIQTCYLVLGIIHTNFPPIPCTFDDYIGLSKPNNYQSLHTCIYPVSGLTYKPVEIQIRTYDMHEIAEYGAAAHWRYKNRHYLPLTSDQQLYWIRNLIQLKDEVGAYNDFVRVLRDSVFQKNIVIFDQTGNVTYVPKNSTAADFALLKNITLDAHMVPKINGRLSEFDRVLHDGDTVEICSVTKTN